MVFADVNQGDADNSGDLELGRMHGSGLNEDSPIGAMDIMALLANYAYNSFAARWIYNLYGLRTLSGKTGGGIISYYVLAYIVVLPWSWSLLNSDALTRKAQLGPNNINTIWRWSQSR
ncbi:hypothetical protein EV363DRAFT_1360476, partial [Boletus edulis]